MQVWGWGGSSRYRTERLTHEIKSDYCLSLAVRHSPDNGASFSPFEVVSMENPRQGGFEREDFWFAVCHDRLRGHDLRFDFQRVFVGTGSEALSAHWQGVESFFDHGLYCVSRDQGRTFSAPRLLRFEMLYPFSTPARIQTAGGEQATSAVRCMIGTWDEQAGDYRWEVSSEILNLYRDEHRLASRLGSRALDDQPDRGCALSSRRRSVCV